MDKPGRGMRAKRQMYQRLAGAWKCQVSAASHAVAAIYTIHHVLDVHIRPCGWAWLRVLPGGWDGGRGRGGEGQDRWAGDSPLYQPWIQTAQKELLWPYVFRQVRQGNVNSGKGCAQLTTSWTHKGSLSHLHSNTQAHTKAVLRPRASVDWSC